MVKTNNSNGTPAVLALWESLRPRIESLIDEKTKNCVRAARATVAASADTNTGKMGVQFPFDDKIIYLPYSSAVSAATVGSQVWVIIPHDNTLTNGVVVQNGTWTL